MRLVLFIIFIATLAGSCHTAAQFPTAIRFADNTVILLADSAYAAAGIAIPDEYTAALRPFDLQIRLNKESGGTVNDYLNVAATQVRNWPVDEQEKIKQAFSDIGNFLKAQNLHLSLPDTIVMIKTAGAEEFGAEGYTRRNKIMLCTNAQQPLNTHLVAHELFHVFSRYNKAKRDAVYAVFGFVPCNRINTAAAMQQRVITNPDCPFTEHYLPLAYNGQNKEMVLQLYSKKTFHPGLGLFDYVNIGLLEIEGAANNKKPIFSNGAGIVHEIEDVPDFLNKTGTNTSYVLHPEEVSAEHFSLWAIGETVSQPDFFAKMKQALR
ncbi:MAG: DUF4157 domain-containing protein [Edaphocola sp.]